MATTKNRLQNLTSGHGTPRSNYAIAVSCCMPIDAFWHGKHSDSLCTSICNPSKMIFWHLLSSYTTTIYSIEILSKFCIPFSILSKKKSKFDLFDPVMTLSPRPAGVWLVTRPAGGGAKAPPEISQTTGPISKFQTPFDSPVRERPVQGQKFDPEVTDDVTCQVKVRIFDISGLVTSLSKISMLSANKAN